VPGLLQLPRWELLRGKWVWYIQHGLPSGEGQSKGWAKLWDVRLRLVHHWKVVIYWGHGLLPVCLWALWGQCWANFDHVLRAVCSWDVWV
jgi:hypothetical protein